MGTALSFGLWEAVRRKGGEATPQEEFVRTVRSWGYQNPVNPREFIIDDVVAVEVKPFGDTVQLHSIRSFDHRAGHGTAVMRRLAYLADQIGVKIELDPVPLGLPKGRIPAKKLTSWYRSLGFQGGRDGMVRQPHTQLKRATTDERRY